MRITERALIARINRKLRHEHEQLHTTRSSRAFWDLGWYYIRDWYYNTIVATHVNIEELGRELGVLRKWETLDNDAPAVDMVIAEQSVAKGVQKNPE